MLSRSSSTSSSHSEYSAHNTMLSRSASTSSMHSDYSASSVSSEQTQATQYSDFAQSDPSSQNVETAPFIPRKPALKIVLGTVSIGSAKSFTGRITTAESTNSFLNIFRSRGYNDIDTARNYPIGRPGTCEKLLGNPCSRLITSNISTKVLSFSPNSHTLQAIQTNIRLSLKLLNVPSLDILYLHAPDRSVSLLEACTAINTAYQAGTFERFGLSNYTPADVEEIMTICETHNLLKPSVYQGQYNLLCRDAEDSLFQVLRKHKIAFYAYSPAAGGFLSNQTSPFSIHDSTSRFSAMDGNPLGQKYSATYFLPTLMMAAESIKTIAAKYGISGHTAALRWTVWHSALDAAEGDALIVGASSEAQLVQNLDALEQGPLPDDVVEVIERCWEEVQGCEGGPRCELL